MTLLIAVLAGGCGAVARYLASGWTQRGFTLIPVGTAVVNLAGAFALGLVAGSAAAGSMPYALGAGFLGGFTTFSTWAVETLDLAIDRGLRGPAAANLAVHVIGGVTLAGIGYTLVA